jgi:hypothetical protein
MEGEGNINLLYDLYEDKTKVKMDSVLMLIHSYLPEDSMLEPDDINKYLRQSLKDRSVDILPVDLVTTIEVLTENDMDDDEFDQLTKDEQYALISFKSRFYKCYHDPVYFRDFSY